MNWSIEGTAADIENAAVEVTHGTNEDPEAQPTPTLVAEARDAAGTLAGLLGGAVAVAILGHESTIPDDNGFMPGHVRLTVSRLNT